MGAHLIAGEFQSDKYPTTPRGKVPLSVKDKVAQPLLWQYAEAHRSIDAEFSDDLQEALRLAGYVPQIPVTVTPAAYPNICAAMAAIEEDNGGHLIGTVYPGTPIDLERFVVPPSHVLLVLPAELGLARLRETSQEDWDTFVCGEQSDAEAIEERQGDLIAARKLLNDWFNDWQEG